MQSSTHTANKSYCCEFCGKSFSRKGTLRNHLITHTGEKPYTCDFCQKSFSYKHVLKKHFRAHTGEKPHVCDVCQKPFSLVENLTKHLRRMHSGEQSHSWEQLESKSTEEPKNKALHVEQEP